MMREKGSLDPYGSGNKLDIGGYPREATSASEVVTMFGILRCVVVLTTAHYHGRTFVFLATPNNQPEQLKIIGLIITLDSQVS
jgi:hypothetical protein